MPGPEHLIETTKRLCGTLLMCAVIFVVVFGAFLTLIVLQGRRLARVDAAGDAPVDRPAPGIIC